MRFLGFDPGGKNAFAWAVLNAEGQKLAPTKCGTCSTAVEALTEASRILSEPPIAIGVDAPLFWAQEGDRAADRIVRRLVVGAGGAAGTVNHVNSLRGACLVQGVLVAMLAKDRWPNAKITEAHPKALLSVSTSASSFASGLKSAVLDEHQRDAYLAAYSAFAFSTHLVGWHDLAAKQNVPFYPGGSTVAYWFPDSRT